MPAPLIRRNMIIRKLRNCGAFSPVTAKTLSELGMLFPNAFSAVTAALVRQRIICMTDDGKYYICK